MRTYRQTDTGHDHAAGMQAGDTATNETILEKYLILTRFIFCLPPSPRTYC